MSLILNYLFFCALAFGIVASLYISLKAIKLI